MLHFRTSLADVTIYIKKKKITKLQGTVEKERFGDIKWLKQGSICSSEDFEGATFNLLPPPKPEPGPSSTDVSSTESRSVGTLSRLSVGLCSLVYIAAKNLCIFININGRGPPPWLRECQVAFNAFKYLHFVESM